MYFIIEDEAQLEQLEQTNECFIQLVTLNSHFHPKLTSPSLIYYNDTKKGYIFVIQHSEGFSLNIKSVEAFLNKIDKVYLLDKKFHSYFLDIPKSIDLHFIHLDKKNEYNGFECDTLVHRDYSLKYGPIANLNEIIPISKHYERCECLYELVKGYFNLEIDTKLQDEMVESYKTVEEAGIEIDLVKFLNKYPLEHREYSIKGNTIYSYYNLYNLTGRPTNSYNNVNFVAIPKDREYRECFVHKNDLLVEFDFDSYHLRLISKLLNQACPNESMHTFLGKIYFNKEALTDEEYKESKAITFKQLYGGIEDQYKHIEFFKNLDQYIKDQWKRYNSQGALILPTGRILNKLPGMNKLKLFNYLIQNMETKENIYKIKYINEYLKNKKSKLILITYDSFLFDFAVEEGKETLQAIKTILESGGMVVKHKYGLNYNL